ncbi:hypothetical protein JSE7799_02540 [Jannaschia seosinensis]|uniref:Uncharacterized protein n=1 Tax=Jannaschia seosinensis TaxID=313367 RepID=A0A0M7BDD6_9RHOB|nr:hypothetical protein JSE7799_02540 [Jannaschia seosinensis]
MRSLSGHRRAMPCRATDGTETVKQRNGTPSSNRSASERVTDDVRAPALVRLLRDRHRCPRVPGALAAATLAHGEPLLAIDAVEPCGLQSIHWTDCFTASDPVRVPALAPKKEVQAPIAEPAPFARQLAQASVQGSVVVTGGAVAAGTPIDPDPGTGAPPRMVLLDDGPVTADLLGPGFRTFPEYLAQSRYVHHRLRK